MNKIKDFVLLWHPKADLQWALGLSEFVLRKLYTPSLKCYSKYSFIFSRYVAHKRKLGKFPPLYQQIGQMHTEFHYLFTAIDLKCKSIITVVESTQFSVLNPIGIPFLHVLDRWTVYNIYPWWMQSGNSCNLSYGRGKSAFYLWRSYLKTKRESNQTDVNNKTWCKV